MSAAAVGWSWFAEPPVWAGVLSAAIAFAVAQRRVLRSGVGTVARFRWRTYLAGLASVLVSLTGPIGAGADTSFAVHMIQHLLLTMVAAPLLVLSGPITLALQAWPGAPRRRLLRALRSRPSRLLGEPVVAWGLFFVVLWGSHFSGLYEAALRSEAVHAAEHLAYLASALLFWMPIAGRDPGPGRLSHPARILYLFLAMPAMAFLGLALFSAHAVIYPTYAVARGPASALADQRVAGALMWNGGMVLVVPAMAFVLFDWMRADAREARRVDERLRRERREPRGRPSILTEEGAPSP